MPRRVFAIRPLTPGEVAALNPFLAEALIPVSNLLPLPLIRINRRQVYEV
jgi:hypothetical protein